MGGKLGLNTLGQQGQHPRQVLAQAPQQLQGIRVAQGQGTDHIVQRSAFGQQVFKKTANDCARELRRPQRKLGSQRIGTRLLQPLHVVFKKVIPCRMAKRTHGAKTGPHAQADHAEGLGSVCQPESANVRPRPWVSCNKRSNEQRPG